MSASRKAWQNIPRGKRNEERAQPIATDNSGQSPSCLSSNVGQKMKRGAKLLISLTVLGLIVFCYFQAPILPFRSVTFIGGPDHILSDTPLKKEEQQAVAAVLEGYGVRHLQTESGILVTPRLFFDREMRWNYTSKAK
jgi:hypothetical protein